MTFNSKDQYEATLGNLVHVLTLQPQARIGYDEFRACIMIAPMGTEEWQRLTDTNMIELRHKIEVIQGFAPIGRELMRDSLQLIAERHKFDSASTWLDGLVWDGVPRIASFMSGYCGAEDSEYTRAVSMYMWSGLAGRLFEPGCQLDMVIAMQSPQGRKKSTGFRLLAPNPDAFTDGISLQHDDDNFKRLLRGKCIVEIAEMAGLSKADNDVVKRVITRRTEEWIEKYQTVPTRFDRRCMLFASTNNERFLPADETGHRRWLPIQIQELNREMIERDRDQLWAEGAAVWRAMGIQWADAERLAPALHKQYEQTDVWDAKIAEWLVTPQQRGDRTLPPPCERPFTVSDVLQGAIGMTTERMDPRAEKRAASVLRLLDYEPRLVRIDGKPKRAWFSKLVPPPPSD
jgi:predicted P-loop ATPase